MSSAAATPGHHPGTLALSEALGRSAPLSTLLKRSRESGARFAAVGELVPQSLREALRPGPLDDDGWTLLAEHAAAAAKVRQLLPRLNEALCSAGWPATPIRIRIQPRA